MPVRGCVGIWEDIQHVLRIWSKNLGNCEFEEQCCNSSVSNDRHTYSASSEKLSGSPEGSIWPLFGD